MKIGRAFQRVASVSLFSGRPVVTFEILFEIPWIIYIYRFRDISFIIVDKCPIENGTRYQKLILDSIAIEKMVKQWFKILFE